MAEIQKLSVELRNDLGKRRNRRLRSSGKVPAVLYGHKKPCMNLAIPSDALEAVLRHGQRFVELTGGAKEQAFITECQWDTWGARLLHVDLTRVSAHEKIQVMVAVELRGEAPGVKEGGVVKHLLHQIELECQAASIPDKIEVNINHLALNAAIHVSELSIPAGAKLLVDAAAIVVSCTEAVEIIEEETLADGAEPEVIGRKKAEEDEE